MSTRAYFIGGPLDGHANDFKVRPPNRIGHDPKQSRLLLGPWAPPGTVTYEKHFAIDEDGAAVHYYTPEGQHATAIRDMLEQRLKEKNDVNV